MGFFRLGRWYFLNYYQQPWKTQMLTAGCIAATGDFVAQYGIQRRRTLERYNFTRTARFFGFGCFYFAPVLRWWYAKLNKYVHVRAAPKFSPLLRVAVDQFFFSPCMVSVFLILLRLSEGNSLALARKRWVIDFWEVYPSGLTVWPFVQLFNFYFVPLHFQMLLVQTAGLFYNSYTSWKSGERVDLTGAPI